MGNTGWTGADSAREAALRRATQYLLARYSIRPASLDPVHKDVAAACCEAALRALNGTLYQDVQAQAVIRETIDVITTEYSEPRNGGQTRIAIVDDLLRQHVVGGAGQISLIRA